MNILLNLVYSNLKLGAEEIEFAEKARKMAIL
jgi:hypothetical protein